MDRFAPHAPAFFGGMGVGALAARALSTTPVQQPATPAASANYYDQYYRQ